MEGALREGASEEDRSELKVIETLRYEEDRGFLRLEQHIRRCEETCAMLGAPFDRSKLRKTLDSLAPPPVARIRITVDLEGRMEICADAFDDTPRVWRLSLCAHRLDAEDRWLRVKTTRRAVYDAARAALPEGIDEWLFANQHGKLCEGAITNVFLDFGDGLVTPPTTDGLLPGILRRQMIDSGQAREESVPIDRLHEAKSILVGNALRGLIPARLDP